MEQSRYEPFITEKWKYPRFIKLVLTTALFSYYRTFGTERLIYIRLNSRALSVVNYQ